MSRKKQKRATSKARKVTLEKSFYVSDGSVYTSLRELAKGLRVMHPDTYGYHANEHKNDFHNWIRDVLSDKKLAQEVLTARDQVRMARMVEARLKARK